MIRVRSINVSIITLGTRLMSGWMDGWIDELMMDE